jgi:protein-S-isoprenylcysteine O-methyltransferase Ste14
MFLLAILGWAAWTHHPWIAMGCLAQILLELIVGQMDFEEDINGK